jgi:hypothetical protein
MEQGLLSAAVDELDNRTKFVIQYSQAQDMLIAINCGAILGLCVVVFMLAREVHSLKVASHAGT